MIIIQSVKSSAAHSPALRLFADQTAATYVRKPFGNSTRIFKHSNNFQRHSFLQGFGPDAEDEACHKHTNLKHTQRRCLNGE